jgi:hypothetical protein
MLALDIRSAAWRKSTRSSGAGSNCVEVAVLDTVVGVRDSKDRNGPMLVFTATQWSEFLNGARSGRFDPS